MSSPARSKPETSHRLHAVAAGEGERPRVPETSGEQPARPAHRTPDAVAVLTGVLSAGMGVIALAYPVSSTAMALAATLNFVLLGLVFVAMGLRWRVAALCTAAAVGLSDLVLLAGYTVYGEPGLDARALIRWWPESPFNLYAMNPNAGLGFFLVAVAVLLLTAGRNFRSRLTAVVLLGSTVVALGLYGVAGRLTGLQSTYGMGRLTGMVFPVACGLVLLGAAALAASWQQGRHLPAERQLWILAVVAMTGIVTSTSLWRALLLLETLHFESAHQLRSYSAGAVLILGLLATALLGAAVYLVQTARQRVSAAEHLRSAAEKEAAQRQLAEHSLARTNAYNRSLIEASIDPLVTIGSEGKITDVNAATEAATGRSRQELIGTDFCDYFTDPEKARAGYQQAFREGGVRDYELEIRHRDGRITPVLYNASIYHDQGGAIAGVFAAARDISERRRGEAALRQLAAIVEFSEDAIISKSLDGTIVTWNKAAERLYDYTAAEAIGENMRIIVPPELHQELTLLLHRVGCGEYIEHHDTVRLRKDGSRVDVSVSLSPVKDEAGNIAGVSTIVRDITERKRLEEELRGRQAYTRSLIEASLDPLVTIATDGKITDVNAATEAVTGCSRQELIGSDFSNYFTDPGKARAGYQQVFAEGRVEDYPLAIRHRCGRVTDVLYNASVFRNEAGTVEGVFAAARDITERKQLEEALRARQAYTRSLIEASLDPLVTIAPDGKITDVNAATEAVTGCSRQELIGTDFCDYFTEPERARAGYQQVFREGGVRDYELEIRHRDGHIIPVLYNASVYHDQTGKVIGVFAAARDVSEAKKIAHELHCSEERYRALVLASSQIVWSTPPDGQVEDMPAWREYTGQLLEQVRGWGWLNAIHPEDRERTAATWAKAVDAGALYETEYRIRRADGQYRHFAIRGVPVSEEDGRIREWVGICTDIHERKQIEDELRKQATLLSLAHDAIIVSDLQHRITFWNRGAEETYGWSAKEAVGGIAPELLHAEFPLPLPEIQATVQQKGEWEGELKQLTRDGKSIVVASRWSLQRDHHGDPASMLEINRDISERKHLEEDLRSRQAYTRSLIEASLDPLVTISSDGKITDVNRATEEVTGVERGQLVDSDFCDYFTHPDQARAGYKKVFAEGLVQDYPLAIRHRSGRITDVLYNASVFRNQAGEVEGVFAAARNVTERKRLEDSLRQRTLELENSVAELEAFSYSVSHDLRAPLRSIDGFSQILLEDYRDKVDAEGQDSLRRIRNASQNMGQLIDALLQLSRVMRSELVREPVDLSMLALSTAALIQKAEPARQVRFHVENGLHAHGDRRLLGVLLQNLLQNAWKFTARSPEPLIQFGSTQKDNKTAYYVRDNGIGFDMNYVSKLFTPFQRLHAREQFEGTGIGLATVKRVVSRHSGQVWAEAEVGRGATFYFTLD